MASSSSNAPIDLRSELVSGDPVRQSRALLAVLGLLSAGREVTSYVSTVCQVFLGNANATSSLKCTAYDVAMAATLTEAEYSRIALALQADIQKGVPAELKVKALEFLPLLPTHRLLAFLNDTNARERLGAALSSPTPAVRAAAIDAVATLCTMDAICAAAHDALSIGAVLSQLVVTAVEGVVDDAPLIVNSSCYALSSIFTTAWALRQSGGAALDSQHGIRSSSNNNNNNNNNNSVRENDMNSLMQQPLQEAPFLSESSTSAVVKINLAFAAATHFESSVFGAAIARFRTLTLGMQTSVPPLLVSFLKYLRAEYAVHSQSLDAIPGQIPGVASYAFEESAALLSEMLRRGDPPLVLSAVQGLFELAEMDVSSATLQAMFPAAISAVINTAMSSSNHQRAIAQRAVLTLLLDHLEIIPSIQRASLFDQLPPMIAALPAASDRVRSFYQLWSAIVHHDWEGAASALRRVSAQQQQPKEYQLDVVISDPGIKEAISGALPDRSNTKTSRDPGMEALDLPHPFYSSPIFREELVATLLYVLLTHQKPSAFASSSSSSSSSTLSVEAASSLIARASTVQVAASAVDWLISSKIALLGTKPCLGWDRAANNTTTGTTAVVDMWLQLLLRCMGVTHRLKERLGGEARAFFSEKKNKKKDVAAVATAAASNLSPSLAPSSPSLGQSHSPAHDTSLGRSTIAHLVRKATELETEFQGLLLQIAANWRALHPVARPRAVWLCACHLRLRNIVDNAWISLADAVRGLLADIGGGSVGGVDIDGYVGAVSQGILRLREEEEEEGEYDGEGHGDDYGSGGGMNGNSPGRKGDGSINKGAEATTPSTTKKKRGRHAAALAANAGESEEVALLTLERLSGLVAANHCGKLQGHLSGVAQLLEKVAALIRSSAVSTAPALGERLARVQLLLQPVATATGTKKGKEDTKKKQGTQNNNNNIDGNASSTVVVELNRDAPGSSPSSASYPSTLPTAASLFHSQEALRYRHLMEQLQSAALARSIAAAGGADAAIQARRNVATASINSSRTSNNAGNNNAQTTNGLPSLHQLSQILESESLRSAGLTPPQHYTASSSSTSSYIEVSGPTSPISLFLSHVVDPGASTVRLQCTTLNKTSQSVSGIVVTLLLGGPIAGNKRPLTFHLSMMAPMEETHWEVPLRFNKFGWPVVQPALTLPISVVVGMPSLRCRPYSISPLQLLAPAARTLSPLEFYQRWQSLPYKTTVAVIPTERGATGVYRLMTAIEEGAGLTCVLKVAMSATATAMMDDGGVHAAFHGTAWSGESIALILTSTDGRSGGDQVKNEHKQCILNLHFGSEASDVVAHIRGHEAELVSQLAGRYAVPASGLSGAGRHVTASNLGYGGGTDVPKTNESETLPMSTTLSFLRSVTAQNEIGIVGDNDGGDGDEDAKERDAAATKETEVLGMAAVAHWREMYALRASSR